MRGCGAAGRREESRQLARGLFNREIGLNDEKQGGDRDSQGEMDEEES